LRQSHRDSYFVSFMYPLRLAEILAFVVKHTVNINIAHSFPRRVTSELCHQTPWDILLGGMDAFRFSEVRKLLQALGIQNAGGRRAGSGREKGIQVN